MTQDIFTHLEDILAGLKEIQAELESQTNNPELHNYVVSELETDVLEPLLNSIDSLDSILESALKMDDADAFYDPYEEGLE